VWRARDMRRVLNGQSNKKLGKWQCNYDASNFDVATVYYNQILRADAFRDRPPRRTYFDL